MPAFGNERWWRSRAENHFTDDGARWSGGWLFPPLTPWATIIRPLRGLRAVIATAIALVIVVSSSGVARGWNGPTGPRGTSVAPP